MSKLRRYMVLLCCVAAGLGLVMSCAVLIPLVIRNLAWDTGISSISSISAATWPVALADARQHLAGGRINEVEEHWEAMLWLLNRPSMSPPDQYEKMLDEWMQFQTEILDQAPQLAYWRPIQEVALQELLVNPERSIRYHDWLQRKVEHGAFQNPTLAALAQRVLDRHKQVLANQQESPAHPETMRKPGGVRD